MMSPGQAAVGTAPLLAAYGLPFGFCEGGADASREDSDAPCARSASFEDRRDFRQRDRPAAESGAVDCPIGEPEPKPSRGEKSPSRSGSLSSGYRWFEAISLQPRVRQPTPPRTVTIEIVR